MANKNNSKTIIYSDLINDYEIIIIEVLNYSIVRSKYYFIVGVLCPYCNNYLYQKSFTKFRYAKKLFMNIRKDLS